MDSCYCYANLLKFIFPSTKELIPQKILYYLLSTMNDKLRRVSCLTNSYIVNVGCPQQRESTTMYPANRK